MVFNQINFYDLNTNIYKYIGMVCAFLMKTFRYLSLSATVETVIVFFVIYLSYLISETLHYSGVVSILFCGMTVSHYN